MVTEFDLDNGVWKRAFEGFDKNGDSWMEWRVVLITDVPVKELLVAWEDLVAELADKEVELVNKKYEYNQKEFEIVYVKDIDFKGMYGSTAEKVRKQHAAKELRSLDEEIKSLELSVAWIKHYIPLIKEVIMYKRNNMPPLSTPAPVIFAGDSVDPKTIKKSIEKAVKECKW